MSGGTLQYTGSTASTDRNYTLNAATSSTIEITTDRSQPEHGRSRADTTGGLTKIGPGTLTLSGTNLYTGTTAVSAGTLQVGSGGTTGSVGTGGITITDNTALSFNRTDVVTIANISGTGFVNQIGTGTTILSGFNSYFGTTTISAGTLQVGSIIPTSSDVIDNATLDLAGHSTGIGRPERQRDRNQQCRRYGDPVCRLYQQQRHVQRCHSERQRHGGIHQGRAGTEKLAGTNTYTGVTTISAGTLSVAAIGNGGVAGNLGQATNAATNLFLSGGTLQYTGTSASTDRNYTLNATTSAIEITIAGTNLTIAGAGANTAGGLAKIGPGTLTLTGANLYTGPTIVTAGTLQVGSGGTTGSLVTFSITDNAALNFDRSDTVTVGNISGTGSVNQIGTGTTILAGNYNYTGATIISAGTLLVDSSLAAASAASVSGGATLGGGTTSTPGTIGGTVSDAGILSPGQSFGSTGTGVLNTGNVTFNSGSAFDVDLNGTTAGSGYDQLNVIGTVGIATTGTIPTLNVSVATGFAPSVGNTFTIIHDTSTLTGTFGGLAQGAYFLAATGQLFQISYTGGTGNDVVIIRAQVAGHWCNRR